MSAPTDPAATPATDPAPEPAMAGGVPPSPAIAVEALQPVAPPAGGRSRRRRLALALALVLLPVAAMAAATGGLVAWDAQYEGRVLPGVHVGGVDLSGLDRSQAAAAIAAAYPYQDGRIVLRAPERDLVVPFAAIGRRPDVDALVEEALAAGRDRPLPERAIDQVRQAMDGTTIAPRVLVDVAAVEAQVAAALVNLREPAVDATIAKRGDGIVVTPARAGQTVDPGSAIAAATDAVTRPDAPAEVVIEVRPTTVAPAVDDAAVAEARLRAERLIGDIVVTHKDRRWRIRAATVRSWVTFTTLPDGTPTVTVDTSRVGRALRKPTRAVLRPPVNALYLKGRRGKVVGVVASRDGRRLDLDATVARITAELDARAAGGAAGTVAVAVARVEPKLTTEEATRTAPLMHRLGKWTTYFPISERNYWGANIWRPAELIDGTVLSPGEKFDWWAAIWPVTPARGFGPGGYIRGSYTDPTGALGGGMCSSSTTLFNAAMRAGLRMGARANHKYYINRYPLGLDATVSVSGSSRQTMSFWNDTRHPIVIRAFRIRQGSSGYVRYEIWGIPDGRTVSLSRPSVSNVRRATTETVYVDTLPPGVREQTEYPADGMDVRVSRVVRDSRGRVLHRDTWFTHYTLWNGRIEVGRKR